jgi:hypothetical protein
VTRKIEHPHIPRRKYATVAKTLEMGTKYNWIPVTNETLFNPSSLVLRLMI